MKNLARSILLLICFGFLYQTSYSCICVQVELKDEIEKTDFIFVGKVVEIIEDKSYVPTAIKVDSPTLQYSLDRIASTRKRFLVKFKVKENYKGVKGKEIILVQYRSEKESPCPGIYFNEAKTYLVFAYKNEENGEIRNRGICSRSQKFNKNSEGYKELVKLKKKRSSLF